MIQITFHDGSGVTLACEEISGSGLTVIMAKRNPDGTLSVESFVPLDVDDHPDTLRQIGGRVVSFAE